MTIPKAVRERLSLVPCDEVEFVELDGATYLRRRTTGSPFARWRGYLKEYAGQDPDEFLDELRGR